MLGHATVHGLDMWSTVDVLKLCRHGGDNFTEDSHPNFGSQRTMKETVQTFLFIIFCVSSMLNSRCYAFSERLMTLIIV